MVAAAIIGGVAAIGGAAVAGNATKKASNAAVAAGEQNNAQQRDIYNKNTANLTPFMQRGNAAGANINALLGLGGDQAGASRAFDQFRGSTGYDFRLNQGVGAINQNNATAGLLKSGKSLKDLTAYGQGIGSQEFGNYLGYLGNQQAGGLSGANALAGVGTNYANATSANNNATANTVGNAALAGASNTNNLLNSLLGAGSMYLGQRQSSYGAPKLPTSEWI